MKKRLSRVELAPDMVLAEDILRGDGALLLPADTRLTPRHLASFDAWGVDSAVVAVAAPEAADETPETHCPEPPSAEQVCEAAQAIRPRFLHADLNEPANAAVFEVCAPFAARVMARRGKAALALPATPALDALPPLPTEPPLGPEALIESDPKLTSLPDVFVRINEVLANPMSTSQEAAEAIGMDTGLSAKLLRMVNSALYGFPVKVDTLSRAVTIVGSRQLTTLALGLSVLAIFKDLPPGLVDMRSFWKHSIGCGVIASSLAPPDSGAEVERLFVAGLLHDVGRLVLYRCQPRILARVVATARAKGRPLREVERARLGYDHAILGGMLLRCWRFPVNLEKAVRHHHGQGAYLAEAMPAAVHVADAVVGAMGLGSSGEIYAPALSPTAWRTLDLTAERLAGLVLVAETQIEDILQAFLPDEA